MIDKTKPAPGHDVLKAHDGWCVTSDAYGLVRTQIPTEAKAIAKSHELFQKSAAPAVIDFAERVSAWLCTEDSEGWTAANREWWAIPEPRPSEVQWTMDQILAAARGERSMP